MALGPLRKMQEKSYIVLGVNHIDLVYSSMGED